jgi:hypothetical protein
MGCESAMVLIHSICFSHGSHQKHMFQPWFSPIPYVSTKNLQKTTVPRFSPRRTRVLTHGLCISHSSHPSHIFVPRFSPRPLLSTMVLYTWDMNQPWFLPTAYVSAMVLTHSICNGRGLHPAHIYEPRFSPPKHCYQSWSHTWDMNQPCLSPTAYVSAMVRTHNICITHGSHLSHIFEPIFSPRLLLSTMVLTHGIRISHGSHPKHMYQPWFSSIANVAARVLTHTICISPDSPQDHCHPPWF